MRYRGFELTATPTRGTERVQTRSSGKELCKGFFCEVYAAHAPDCCSSSGRAENMLQMLGANVLDESIYHDEDEHPGIVPAM